MPLRFSKFPLYCYGHAQFYIFVLHLTLENASKEEWGAQVEAGGQGCGPGTQPQDGGWGESCELALPDGRKANPSLCKKRKAV